MKLYPIVFEPLLKPIMWGGDEICKFKGLSPIQDGIGESWEVSHVKNSVSVVSNGELKGQSLDQLIHTYEAQLLGENVLARFGKKFPLLIKFIDARDHLSIQVHPDDALAKARHDSFGKTEMWYVISAKPGAFLYSGFAKQLDAQTYVENVENNTFVETLEKHETQAGDVFFLPAGRVHAIGAGCFIAEIQQTSDITYRIYDFNRKDAQGNSRELHTELAKDAIDYTISQEYKLSYAQEKDKFTPLVDCPYFTTNLLETDKRLERDLQERDSFSIYICMQGKLTIKDELGALVEIRQGQTALIPASCKSISLIASENCKIMETYINKA